MLVYTNQQQKSNLCIMPAMQMLRLGPSRKSRKSRKSSQQSSKQRNQDTQSKHSKKLSKRTSKRTSSQSRKIWEKARKLLKKPSRGFETIVNGTPAEIQKLSKDAHVVMFSTTTCPYCVKAKDFFVKRLNVYPRVHYLDKIADPDVRARAIKNLQRMTQHKTVPNVFVFQKHVGGFDDCVAAYKKKKFEAFVQLAHGLLRTNGSWSKPK